MWPFQRNHLSHGLTRTWSSQPLWYHVCGWTVFLKTVLSAGNIVCNKLLCGLSYFRNETLCVVKCLENDSSCPTLETRSLREVCGRTKHDFTWAQYPSIMYFLPQTDGTFNNRLKSKCAKACKENPICDGIEIPINSNILSCSLIKLTQVFDPTHKPTHGKEIYVHTIPKTSQNGFYSLCFRGIFFCYWFLFYQSALHGGHLQAEMGKRATLTTRKKGISWSKAFCTNMTSTHASGSHASTTQS